MANKDVVKVDEPNDVSSVGNFITLALEKGAPVEALERLFVLHEKVKAENAKSAFLTALARFQEVCQTIEKKKKVLNKDGQSVRYQYAPLGDIVNQIKKPLADNGLAYTWDVKNEVGFITAIATITHTLGHSQTSEFKVPVDTEGFMTAPQKYASALTFAKRYSLINALGVSTGEEDTDAVDVGKEVTAKSNKAKIIFLLKSLGYTSDLNSKESIVKVIKSVTKLTAEDSNLDEIVDRLEVLVREKQNDSQEVRQ